MTALERTISGRLARNVARLRADRELTVCALAERAGLHWRHLQKIEAGTSNATLTTLARLATGLEVKIEALVKVRPKRSAAVRRC